MSSSKAAASTSKPLVGHKPLTARDVFFFIPNKIGYSRVLTAIISFCTMSHCPVTTAFIYATSCLLDAMDGKMARKYNQTSNFGAVLDMVTDRSTTAGLMCYLSMKIPALVIPLQLLLGLDISSHYMHMYAALTSGSGSHKNVEESNWLLHLYYTNRKVLFVICFFNEVWYASMYMMTWEKYYTFGLFWFVISTPGFIFKQVANVIQLCRAANIMAHQDAVNANAKHAASKK